MAASYAHTPVQVSFLLQVLSSGHTGRVMEILHPFTPPFMGVLSAVVILIIFLAGVKYFSGMILSRNINGTLQPVSINTDVYFSKSNTRIFDLSISSYLGCSTELLGTIYFSFQFFH
jgi:hypothetical protein